jgi:hypothetical protein
MFYWGWSGLQERRKAIMHRIQRKILRLAAAKGGTLTVTEVAADLNLGLPAAEKILTSMDDGFRVRSEISDAGVIYYEFPEILHRKELGRGNLSRRLRAQTPPERFLVVSRAGWALTSKSPPTTWPSGTRHVRRESA